jgi:Heme exporter protein D (CcmD)
MNPWPFVIGAYAAAILGTLGLTLWSWAAMRRAEAEAERLGDRS